MEAFLCNVPVLSVLWQASALTTEMSHAGPNAPDDKRDAQPALAPSHGSDDDLATKLLCALSAEMIYKADLFDYLCWLEETHQSDAVPGAKYLVMASDGTTCWGNSYSDALKVAMKHDKELYDACTK